MAVVLALFVITALMVVMAGHRRRLRSDIRSVETHHGLLARLEHIDGYDGNSRAHRGQAPPHVRILQATGPAPHTTGREPYVPRRSAATARAPGGARRPLRPEPVPTDAGTEGRILFFDDYTTAAFAASDPGTEIPEAPGRRPVRPSRGISRRLVVAAGALGAVLVAAVAAGGALTAGVLGRPSPQPRLAPPASKIVTAPARVSATPTPISAPRTTSPPVLSSRGPATATYVVPSAPVDLSVLAVERCWVEVRSGSATGPLLFQGILGSGASKRFTDPAGVWLRLGYPAGARLNAGGSPLSIPASTDPYDVTVQTGAAGPGAVGRS